MDTEFLRKIKRLVIIAMFSDDDLMDILVLKGGNALDIIHQIEQRASVDLDFSIEKEFRREDLPIIESKIQKILTETFKAEGYEVFDVTLVEKPEKISPEMAGFWGGYQVQFKIIESEDYARLSDNINSLRRNALVVGNKQKRKIKIDISKFEYCIPKQKHEMDGYTIYVYTPEMIVIEKLRAICQQMPEYADIVTTPSRSARARDFFDIYITIEHFGIDLTTSENTELLKNIFTVKKVPLQFIGNIQNYKEFHRSDFPAVKDTVKTGTELRDFDFYFDYVVNKCKELESLGVV